MALEAAGFESRLSPKTVAVDETALFFLPISPGTG